MSNMTTQDGFTAMKGHVAHGQQVKMGNGDILTIQSSLTGWCVLRDGEMLSNAGFAALSVERFIVSYRN